MNKTLHVQRNSDPLFSAIVIHVIRLLTDKQSMLSWLRLTLPQFAIMKNWQRKNTNGFTKLQNIAIDSCPLSANKGFNNWRDSTTARPSP